MRHSSKTRLLSVLSLSAMLLTACALNPTVRRQKYFQSAQQYLANHQYREAAIQFTNAIKIDPGFAEAHFQLAQTYMNLQEFGRARQEFDRTIEVRPDDYRARLGLASLLTLFHDFRGAQEQLNTLLNRRPFDPAVHAAAASLMAAENNIGGAIAETQQTISLQAGQWELYLSLGLLQLKNNQPELAEATLKKVVELNPKAVQARVLLGNFYESQKRMLEAEKQFRDAIAFDPGTIEPRNSLAGLYLVEGKTSDAEEVLKQAKRDLPHNPDSFMALSRFYYMTGNLDQSIAEYRALSQERPKELQIHKNLIELLIEANRYDDARALTDQILKANPKDQDALVYRSEMQITMGDVSAATQTLQTVIEHDSKSSQGHYALGVAFKKQGNLGHAETEWREALRLNPDMLVAHQELAAAAMTLGDMNTLQDEASQMIRLRPGIPEGYALRGLANLNLKHYSEAEADIRQSIAVAPQSSYGYSQMGNLRFAQKRYNEAIQSYQAALDRNVNSTDALRGVISTYIAENQVNNAIAAAKTQIAKSPNNSEFYVLLGATLSHDKKDLIGSEAAFEKALSLDDQNSEAVIHLCMVQAVKGEFDRAIGTGEQSLARTPHQEGLLVLMGNLYAARGNWKGAENAFQTALALNSQNSVAANGLARTILRTGGNPDVALALAQRARQGLPESPGVADTLGWIYYQKGIYPLAISFLQEALKLQEKVKTPDSPDIHYHLGMTYKKTQQPALARQEFERVLKLNPNFSDAAEIKMELSRLKA